MDAGVDGDGPAGEDAGSSAQLRRLVAAHEPADAREAASKARFLQELDRLESPTDEHADPVHVTASGLVVGPRGTVLHRHRRLGRWMQPGGHIDAGEAPWQAALREAEEETGLPVSHPPGGPLLLHLDTHAAAEGHTHLDLRYLLLAPSADPRPHEGESPDAGWYGWEDAESLADESLAGALSAARAAWESHRDEWVVAENPFVVVLRVQDRDTAIAQLEHRKITLPDRLELVELERRLSAVTARVAEADGRRRALVERQSEIERQIAAASARQEAVEQRLYSARGSAARDLQAMDEEVHHLVQRRSALEEDELVLMVEQEPVDAELQTLRSEGEELDAAAQVLRERVAVADAEIDEEVGSLVALRNSEAAALPRELSERYETLRARLRGTGAARLVGNRCEGCHLELPSVEVERIHRLPEDVLVTCDNCGRILVRTDAVPARVPGTD